MGIGRSHSPLRGLGGSHSLPYVDKLPRAGGGLSEVPGTPPFPELRVGPKYPCFTNSDFGLLDVAHKLDNSVASPGFFSGAGGTPWPLKGYHAPPAGGPGGEGPPGR